MNIVVVAIVVFWSLSFATPVAAQGNADAGESLWSGNAVQCGNCHGENGEGGFGPDLAGRGLSIEQFRRAVRQPWGIMPAYTEQQVSDGDVANLVAYFDRLPRVAQPGPWRVPVPSGAPAAQQLLIAGVGCGQCHGPDFGESREDAGAAAADFEWFANLVYNHTTASPDERRFSGGNPDNPIRMGNYSRDRLPEPVLRQIWQYVSMDLGLRVPIRGRLSPGVQSDAGVTHELVVENTGVSGIGLAAEGLVIELMLPAGSTVVSTRGDGYQGVRRDAQSGGSVASWNLARLGPKERQTYAITLSAPAAGAEPLRGVARWAKPAFGDGSTDSRNIAPPRQDQ